MKKFTKVLSSTMGSGSASSASTGPVDESGCPAMEGLLLKKNAHGEWKKRHGKLSNTFFITNKPKHKKPTSEIKENIDLREVASVGVYDDVLEIELLNGETLSFMYDAKDASGSSIDDWYSAMSKRHTWAKKFAPPLPVTKARTSSGDAADPSGTNIFSENRIHISGYLQKKSHNKYHGFQERFVKLEGKNLCYFKKKNDDTALGTASMETADFVRAFDASPDCAIFEIQDEDRVFVFQTPSHADMLRWVNVVNRVLQAYKERKKAELEAKIASETPPRIRAYDDLGEDEFITNIEIELSGLYPTSEMETLTLKEHLSCASEVVQYLVDFVPETQSVGADKITRYDILAAVMTEVNTTLTERFSSFIQPQPDGTRHEILENATLGDLHSVIDWIATYKITLNGIKCPVSNTSNTIATASSWLSGTCKTPKACGLFELMPQICAVYVHGGSAGAKGGAAHHLYDHCMKVWESVVNNPEEMIQKHSNGSFYTHAPIDMWEAINQHMSLATSTKSPVLHVMIAEKVVVSLQDVFNTIITYVQTLDTSSKPELREIELEYLSALANDTALHIEEVIELIDTFTISEIRERIDDIFDPLTTLLVQCGQACLKRLAGLVMSDVQATLDEVFMPEWLEGNQVHVATATISDYMGDFEAFLVEFWSAKFVYTILETVILSYTRVILFKKPGMPTPCPIGTPEPPAKVGFFSSLMRKTKEISQKMVSSGPQQCPVDEESLGRLAQDVNTLNAFFSKKAGQEIATEFLAFMNEISLMLFLDGPALVQHVATRATEFPSAAQAIKITALAIMRMRPETISKQHFDLLQSKLEPIIATAPERQREQENENIAEDRLSLLYTDLVPVSLLPKPVVQQTLAQKMKNMAHVNLGATQKGKLGKSGSGDDGDDGSDEEGDSDGEGYRDSTDEGRLSGSGSAPGRGRSGSSAVGGRNRAVSSGLVGDVLEVLNQQDQEDAAIILAQEEERQQLEMLRKKVGVLTYDGYMEKKSPAHNLWQRRWFKITTRETLNPLEPYSYNFLWYKKEGGAVIKSLEASHISNISVIGSPRALSYLPLKQTLMLQSEALNEPLAIVVKNHDPEATAQPNVPAGSSAEQFVTIRILQTDGKDHFLRGAKVDRVIKWINLLSLAASLGYDEHEHVWNHAAFERHKETAADHASQVSFMNIAASKIPSNPKIATTGSPAANGKGTSGGKQTSPGYDPDDAAAAIKTVKLQEMKREEDERAAAAARREEEARQAEEEERLEEERREAELQQQREAKLLAAKKKADELAAARKEAERQQRLAEEKIQQLRLQEEEEAREKVELEKEERDRAKRLAAKAAAASASADAEAAAASSPAVSPNRGSTSTNPIMQQDGKAREVANPIKRVSSVRRVPPPPPPPPAAAEESAPAAAPAAGADANDGAEAEGASSKTPPKVIRMVGKRRASVEKSAHNTAMAGSEGSTISSSNGQSDDEDEAPTPVRSVLKTSTVVDAPADGSPSPRRSESSAASPATGLRKSLSRGVSFASDVKERTSSEMEQPSPPPPAAASPKVIATTKQPFAAAPSTDSQEADPEPEEDAEGDADTFNTEQALSKHVAREGVISGRVYRKSVVVSAKPKAPDAPAEKEGYLMKKSPAMLVGWQKRFFLTNSNGDIEYYKSEADARNADVQPQGVIMIKYIKLDRGVEVDDKTNEISINIGSKTVHLRAKDRAEARAWLSSITQWQLHTA